MSKLNFCIVGCGRIGQVHALNASNSLRTSVVAIVDAFEATRNEWATKLGAKPFASLQEALDSDIKIDAVVVTTPTATHRDNVIVALKQKKPVFCEKPISLNLKEVDECYALAKQMNTPLLCGYQRRHDPSFSELKRRLVEGVIGPAHIIKTTSRDNPIPSIAYLKTSQGLFHDCATHDLDVCRWLAEEDPTEVYVAGTANYKDIGAIPDVDTAIIVLRFASSKIATIDLSRKAEYGYDQRIEVHGEKGMLKAENPFKTSVVSCTKDGHNQDVSSFSFQQRYIQTYAIELNHFMDVVEGKAEPMISHDDARKVCILANACDESLKTSLPVKVVYN